MDDDHGSWQRRIEDLYTNVAELYSHIDITVVIFDRDLVELSPTPDGAAGPLTEQLRAAARRVLDTGEAQRDIALDQSGRRRAHALPLRQRDSVVGAVCVVDDDGARRELFVRCAMAIFDGYRQNEVALLERERKALDEARRANQLRDQFLAVVSHELRLPLASILLWEQVLRAPAVDAETRTTALDAIHESANGQALLVADLMDVSRAINGKLQLDRHVMPLERVLGMAIDNARAMADASRVELDCELAADLGHVLGDSRRLRQVFDNLLSNAIKCTSRGRITVRARHDEETITVDVSDTGNGIAAEDLPYVFEPFWQAKATTAPAGLGLGLSVARQLVELHGGTISAASSGIGAGSAFTVTLPRATASPAQVSSELPTIAGVRVLLVDDDARLLEALQRLLRDAGAIVTTARSAASAYHILEGAETDILVSDIGMAGEDGNSLLRRLRGGSRPMRGRPAIAITARATEDDRLRALDAGFDRYLTKPIDLALLIATIAQLVH